MLVEDEDHDIDLTRRAIDKSDIESKLFVVRDGEEALDFLYRREGFEDSPQPDLVLLDLNLPKIGGHQVLETVKDDRNLEEIPVVVLTVSDREEDIVKAYDSGASSYVQKPVNPAEFRKVVETVQKYWKVVELPSGD